MDAETVLAWVDKLIFAKTGARLSALEQDILQKVLSDKKYLEIATDYGYTEGHVKDVGSQLWKMLSGVLGERITKSTCRAVLERLHPPSPPQPEISPQKNLVVGREAAIAHLDALVNQGSKVIVIQGEGGLGKTTLAQHYLHQGFEVVLELLMAKETANITSAERVVEEWLKQDFQQEPGLEFGVTLDRLKRQLHIRKIGILIDNLEPALDQAGRLIAPHRSYVELLRILTDPRVRSLTLITSRDRLCEPGLAVEHYRLPRLTQAAWHQFFALRLAIDLPSLQQMHRAYGGNAKAMGILGGAILADFAGNMALYWQENQQDLLAATDLKNLVVSQINRLQVLDPDAYGLLCRLGCYRYQDIPALATPGVLCLLWDVPPSQQRQVVTALQNRSLVESDQGKYWLHPVIQAEAIARLRAHEDWEVANRKAAEFWTTSIQTIETTQDALQALEAYYHYIEIQDFESAGNVILNSRNNQWRQFLPLGSTLYRMGLLQPVLAAITQVIQIQPDHKLSELYNILGDLYWITGKIQQATDCQQKTITLAIQALKFLSPEANQQQIYYLRMLQVDSLLSIGLYKIDLWELRAAAQMFQQVIDLAQNTDHHRWAEKASVCLAQVSSCLGLPEAAYALADVIYHAILTEQVAQTGRFAYFIQILGQTYVNLGNFEKANQMYCRALEFAQESHYTQVKARTLNGLAEMYRQQSAFESALVSHAEAIDLLEQIGAKCDLAEAYLQLGLTCQQMNQPEQSWRNFDQAIQLFKGMQAPKQVERVLAHLSMPGLEETI